MDLKTKIKNIALDSFVVNASGPNDATLEELEIIGKSDSAAIMMKSCTIEERAGNPEPRYVQLPLGSIQSMGLPNLGYKKYIEFSSKLKKFNKPIIASVAGLSLEEYILMVEAFHKSEADLIEINFSCPNLEGKPVVAYDFEQSENILKAINVLGKQLEKQGTKIKPLGLKLPPYFESVHYMNMAKLIKKYELSFITCINSVPNTLIIDIETETPIIKPKKGFGALCGEYIKPIALGNVRTFYEIFRGEVAIFGVGGIKEGKDAFEFLLAGADAVQISTTFEKEGSSCFKRINSELSEIMTRKNYLSIEEAKGNLKYL